MSAPRCEFLVRGERGQARCGCPAHYWRNSPGGLFYYCETHGRAVLGHPKYAHKLRKIER